MLLLVPACIEGNTEERSLVLRLLPLHYSAVDPLASGSRVLAGSRACVEVAWIRDGEEWVELSSPGSCYAITVDGAPFADGDCLELDTPAEHLIEYTPLDACPFDRIRDDIVPDRLRLQVVPNDGLRARLEWYLELSALRWYDPGPFPEDLVPAHDEPLRLVPGVEAAFPINVIDAAGERVAWELPQSRLLETRVGAAPRELTPLQDYDELFPVSIAPGERSTLSLELAGVELPVAEVIATPAEAAASLEIVVAYGGGIPRTARAMVRDGEGRVIYGAPVEWTLVEGELAMGPIDDYTPLPLPEYTLVGDLCVPPPSAPEPRRAIVRAQLGELVEEVELEWTAMPEQEPSDEPFEPSARCQQAGLADDGLGDRGCGCSTRSPSPLGAWSWLGWLALAAVRHRRPGGAPPDRPWAPSEPVGAGQLLPSRRR